MHGVLMSTDASLDLDSFEPFPVPSKPLMVAAFCLVLAQASLVTPFDAGSGHTPLSLFHAPPDKWTDALGALKVIFLAPSAAAVPAFWLLLRSARAPIITVRPPETMLLTSLMTTTVLFWASALVYGIQVTQRGGSDNLMWTLGISAGLLLIFLLFGLASLGALRDMIAVLLVIACNFALHALLCEDAGPRGLFVLIYPVIDVVAFVAVGIAMVTYWRQRRLEKKFHDAMIERARAMSSTRP